MGTFKKIKDKFNRLDRIIKPLSNGKLDYLLVAVDYLFTVYIQRIPSEEYLTYNFHNLKHRYRKQFILQKHRKLYTNINYSGITVSKYVLHSYIPDLYKREVILAPQCGKDSFVQFLKKHQRIVIKPDIGSLGKGVTLVNYTNDTDASSLFSTFTKENSIICEEFINQHDVLMQLNPYSVNTIRITSLLKDGEVEILSATLKCGADKDKITDNLSIGGIGAQIDIPSGIVSTFGRDFDYNAYTHHPITGTQIIGMQMPHWDTVLALVKEAHKRLPQCMLLGWDIAITETGADIVEANSRPGCRIMQRMDGIPKGQKVLPLLHKNLARDSRDSYSAECRARFNREHQTDSTTL